MWFSFPAAGHKDPILLTLYFVSVAYLLVGLRGGRVSSLVGVISGSASLISGVLKKSGVRFMPALERSENRTNRTAISFTPSNLVRSR